MNAASLRRSIRVIRSLAWVHFREGVSEVGTAIVVVVVSVFLLLTPAVSLFNFYQRLSAIQESIFDTVTLGGVVLLLFTGTAITHREKTGQTKLLLLSKPVGRGDILVGRFGGLLSLLSVAYLFFAVSALVAAWWAWRGEPQFLRSEAPPISVFVSEHLPALCAGIILSYCKVAVMVACFVVISDFTGTAGTIGFCSAIFTAGHLTGYFLGQAMDSGEVWLRWVAEAFRAVLPNFSGADIRDLVARGTPIGSDLVIWNVLYAGAYVTFVLVGGMVLVRRRDAV